MKETALLSSILSLLTLLPSVVSAKYDPIAQAPEIKEGWTPRQAAEWSGAQIQYAQAVQHFGEDSPQAAAARVKMTTLSRILRPEDREVPIARERFHATHGTYAKPHVFDKWVPVELPETIQ